MAGGSLLAAAKAWAADGDAKGGRQLAAALAKAAAKGSREAREAALQAFRAVQQRLAEPGGGALALAALGSAALAALAALPPRPPPEQLAGWRYNFARRLVSAKAYAEAHAEAWDLFQQLQAGSGEAAAAHTAGTSGAAPASASPETANLAVGTVLTLVLCCVEGRLLGDTEALHGALAAAESLPPWLSLLKPEEAAKHTEAAYRYLYKAAVALVEREAWSAAASTAAALLGAAGDDAAAQRRALAALGKLAAHLPDEEGAAALAAAACHAARLELGSGSAADLLGMLCSAAQRATPSTALVLQRAALACCAANIAPVLRTAGLLLPVLALHLPAVSLPAWQAPVQEAVDLVGSSIQQLAAAAAAHQLLPPGEAQRCLALLEAACLPANALRRALAGQLSGGADVCAALGGAAATNLAAAVLELLPSIVGVVSRLPGSFDSSTSSLSSQGHAAAVGLVTAARLRASCLAAQQKGSTGGEQLLSNTTLTACSLLGWDLQRYAYSSMLPPESCAVDPQELSWLASALFNVGVDLLSSQQSAAAVAAAMHAAVSAAAVGLRALAEEDAPAAEDAASRLADFCRKCSALSDAQRQAGDGLGALHSLGHSVALLLQLGFAEPAAWQPLVQAWVRLQAELLQEEPVSASSTGAAERQPVRRGRGAASKKSTAAAVAAAPASDDTAASPQQALAGLLLQHEADLPDGCILAALEEELLCWAAAQAGGSAAAAHCRSLASSLLGSHFPAAQRPLEHAGVLLALHRAVLPAEDGQSGQLLLERAAAVLEQAPGVAAAAMLARARCMLAIDGAQELARQALLEQQQERQRSNAAASTSAVGSREQDAAVLAQLASGSSADAAAWQCVAQHAAAAVEALRAAGGGAALADSLRQEFGELARLLGLHGLDAPAKQLHHLLPDCTPPASGVLADCLFPAASASAAEAQRQAESAAAEASRTSASVAVQRAALHRQAAEAAAVEGDVVAALFHAAEAHRLLAVLFHGSGEAGAVGTGVAPSTGWWRLVAAYMGSLLQLAQLFEAAGQADEALHALREGQRLAVAAGAAPVAAAFATRVADILCKQGQLAAAEQVAEAAERQLAATAADSLPVRYCQAAAELVRAQLGVAAAAGGSVGKASWQACQAAVVACGALGGKNGWWSALHAAALLTAAEAALQREGTSAALELAADALATTEAGCNACSALRHQRAAVLLFLARHAAAEAAAPEFSVWGLGAAGRGSSSAPSAPAAKGRARKAPAKSAGRGKAAVAAEGGSGSGLLLQQPQQRLWQALELSQGMLAVHRSSATLLAAECGRQGYLHLAAWLLHSSLGAAMRLQYQLVLHSKRQHLVQRQRRGGIAVGDDPTAQVQELDRLTAMLRPSLDWQAVQQLAGTGTPALGSVKGRQAAAKAAAAAGDPAAALAALELQARQQLHAWQASLPADTASCSVSTLPAALGGSSSILVSRLAPASGSAAGQEATPPLLVALPVQQLSASLSQHPIRALRLEDDAPSDDSATATSSVQSVLDEMAAVLADSGRSMRELSTDTKEQQREWWRARLSLDDRLAALVKHLDSSWLGPWRCLLQGAPRDGALEEPHPAAARLVQLLEGAGQPAAPQQAALLHHVAAVLGRHAGSLSPGELRLAAHQLSAAAGLVCSQEQQHELEALLAAQPAEQQQQADADMADAADAAPAAGKKAKGGGKSVKFADDENEPALQQQQQQQQPLQRQEEPASTPAAPPGRAIRGRRPAAPARGRRSAAATAAAEPVQAADDDAPASPVATLGAVGGGGDEEAPATAAKGGLCQVFDSLSLDEGGAPGTAAAVAPPTGPSARGAGTTARSVKSRSRLRMMQAGTPRPVAARRSLAAAATAPQPAREAPLTVAKTAPPPAARPSSSSDGVCAAAAAGPVLLVLDGALQELPWESVPGLLGQRVYRMPSLACAAASALRADTSVDLSSTFYALNPSGDLAATQATFQDWFAGMRGWQGRTGSAPSASELAAALQHHAFYLYCGHGGGEQYISVTKLRSLERCSAALLMGCSSGRLRAQQHYEPAGAVLAYLLAGCPAAVANLWDVTDRDIDRYSQAVLTSWISGGGGGGGESERGADMSAAVGASRAVCKLPHLVGAAPVCYGIPSRIFLS